jgi:hypothetical protein
MDVAVPTRKVKEAWTEFFGSKGCWETDLRLLWLHPCFEHSLKGGG